MADEKASERWDRTKEVTVRKLVALELVSLDGVFESPEEWAFSYSNEEMEEENAAGMAASDAMLLGRVTYKGLAAFWPNQPPGTPMVDYMPEEVPEGGVYTFVTDGIESALEEAKAPPGRRPWP
jgi:dihydrofolate reductase